MSYDLAVFDASVAPMERQEFLSWYEDQTSWGEGHSYDDPERSAQGLRSWFLAMQAEFPAMSGPYANPSLPPTSTDYSVGRHLIYAAFASSAGAKAYETSMRLAKQFGVGFFAASEPSGEIRAPTGDGNYTCLPRDGGDD